MENTHRQRMTFNYLARCPFYHYQAKHKIACDGSLIGSKIELRFMTQAERNSYLDLYCECDYESCHIAQGLIKAYEEAEALREAEALAEGPKAVAEVTWVKDQATEERALSQEMSSGVSL